MNQEENLKTLEAEALEDLRQRLGQLRARMAADGRDAAVRALDRAMARDARSTAKKATRR